MENRPIVGKPWKKVSIREGSTVNFWLRKLAKSQVSQQKNAFDSVRLENKFLRRDYAKLATDTSI